MADPIRIAAGVVVDGAGRTLLVRKRGTAAFMQAGGKINPGESGIAALAREVLEELSCHLEAGHRPLGRFTAPAANEPGMTVEAELFAIGLVGEIMPAAEIEEVIWCHPDQERLPVLAPLTCEHVFPLLRRGTGGP